MKSAALLLLSAIVIFAANKRSEALPATSSAVKYLQRFGYLNVPDSKTGASLSDDEVTQGLLLFQKFVGLPQTGILDVDTREKMKQPRCGVPDFSADQTSGRKKRFVPNGSKWRKKKLTYRITSYTNNLTRVQVDGEIASGFDQWERVSALWFKKARRNTTADITMKFVSGDHGDGEPFDGPYMVLAHALPPAGGGDVHFDNDETWIVGPGDIFVGINLLAVATHEFGHSLGLSHSADMDALMYPYYNPDVTTLGQDDINGIRSLYGNNTDRPLPINENLQKCDAKFDTVTMSKDGTVYAFSGNFFWELNDQGIEEDSLQPTEDVWGFTGDIDASLCRDGYTELFHGQHVRRFINENPVDGYPKLISEQYPGMPSHIDAAWSSGDSIYFMKGDKYWEFNSALGKAYNGYPRLIKNWKGLPESIDAAVQWNDMTYFFKNGQYWRFNDNHMNKDSKGPQKTDKWWPGCEKTSAIATSNKRGTNSASSTAGTPFHVATSLILMAFAFMY